MEELEKIKVQIENVLKNNLETAAVFAYRNVLDTVNKRIKVLTAETK